MSIEYKFSDFSESGIAISTDANGLGILQSVDRQGDIEIYERKNEAGNVIGTEKYNETEVINVEYDFDSTKTAPALGAVFVVGSDNFEVQSKGKSWAVGSSTKLKLTLKRYVTAGYPANA